MSIHIANCYKIRLLRAKQPLMRKLVLRLYVNDLVVTDDLVAEDFVEATFPGYEPISPILWGPPFSRPDDRAEMDTCPLQFTMTAGSPQNTVYGWFATDENGFLGLAARFPNGPVQFLRAGDSYTFAIQFLEGTMRRPPA